MGIRRIAAAVTQILAAIALLSATAQAQAPDPSKVEYRTEKLADNLFVLFGAGGNIAVLTGSDGPLVVDSDVTELSPKLRAQLALLSDKPARFLIDTHFHFDHAGGNPMLGRSGAVIVAQDAVRERLMTRQVLKLDVGELTVEPTPREGLPIVTFQDGIKFHLNGDDVTVVHVPHAHTDGDAFVFFEKANVLHTGDVLISNGYPLIDSGSGGSIDGFIAGHERMLALCNDQTRVIPGHGPVVGKAELQAYHDMVVTVRKRIYDLVRKGRTVEQVLAAQPTREFDERWGGGFIKANGLVQRVYIELKRPTQKP